MKTEKNISIHYTFYSTSGRGPTICTRVSRRCLGTKQIHLFFDLPSIIQTTASFSYRTRHFWPKSCELFAGSRLSRSLFRHCGCGNLGLSLGLGDRLSTIAAWSAPKQACQSRCWRQRTLDSHHLGLLRPLFLRHCSRRPSLRRNPRRTHLVLQQVRTAGPTCVSSLTPCICPHAPDHDEKSPSANDRHHK